MARYVKRSSSGLIWLGMLLALALAAPALAQTPPGDDAALANGLRQLGQTLTPVEARLQAGDGPGALAAYKTFDDGWFAIEDGVRERSRPAYKAIEDAMSDLKIALSQPTLDQGQATSALQRLRGELGKFIATIEPNTNPAPPVASPEPAPVAPTVAPVAPTTAPAPITAGGTTEERLRELSKNLDLARDRLAAGDKAGAEAAYTAWDRAWIDVEDGVRDKSRTSYRAIEDGMGAVKASFARQPFDAGAARGALETLRGEVLRFVEGKAPADAAAAPAAANTSTQGNSEKLRALDRQLDTALARIQAGDAAGAAAAVDAFQKAWPDSEGLVAAKSRSAYTALENDMARAGALLASSPPDLAGARAAVERMRRELAPFLQGELRYGVFDAAIILLREGLEALLIVAALLAFLKQTGNGAKRPWIWAGGGAGIAASAVVAILVQILFSQATAGANRELLEGVVGLVAAAMLLYVSYWLHSKASLGAWQRYIASKSKSALATGRLLSLALIAFLAVFREGAETVLFYVGIAPSISLANLLLGLGLATAALVVLAVLILWVGVRVPMRPFFLVTSLLIFYLCVKFVGTGIHALQVAGVLPATSADFLPSNEFFGLYPTWESSLPQLLIVLGALAVVIGQRLRRGPTAAQSSSPAAKGAV